MCSKPKTLVKNYLAVFDNGMENGAVYCIATGMTLQNRIKSLKSSLA